MRPIQFLSGRMTALVLVAILTAVLVTAGSSIWREIAGFTYNEQTKLNDQVIQTRSGGLLRIHVYKYI